MKRLLLLLSLCFPSIVFAQIKKADASMVAGENTAKEKAYSEIATKIPRYDPETMLYLKDVLCSGELVYSNGNAVGCSDVIHNGKFYHSPYGGNIPEGYYKVQNVFLTKESLKNSTYGDTLAHYCELPDTKQLLLDIERYNPYSLGRNKVCVELVSEDSDNIYFTELFEVKKAIPVRSYELYSNALLGKDVRLLIDPHRYGVRYVDFNDKRQSLTDVITEDYIPISTSHFHCIDIAVMNEYKKGYGQTQMVAVLENNGNRFALKIKDAKSYDYGIEYETNEDHVFIMTEDDYKKMAEYNDAKRKQYEAERLRTNKERQQRMIEKYGETFGPLVNNSKVVLGMTQEMVLSSWGFPETTFSHTNVNGNVTIWSYGLNYYITFTSGKVTAITHGKF